MRLSWRPVWFHSVANPEKQSSFETYPIHVKPVGTLFFISNWFCNLCSKLFLYENSILWYWVTYLPGFKIMESFASGPENINVTNAVQIWSKKIGSAKLPLPTLQVILLECWLYLIQNYIIFMQFICVSFLFFFF